MENEKLIWENILASLAENINEQSYRTWFENTNLKKISADILYVQVNTEIAADYLNKHYAQIVADLTFSLFNKKFTVKFEGRKNANEPSFLSPVNLMEKHLEPRLNPKYTFEGFVVGKSNNFAHSAAIAVSESPGERYNPLFIYGESGMGKTHLMQSIGNYVLELDPTKIIYYTTTESFMNEMIEAIQKNSMPKFRSKFRSIDVLLIDDIHFLSKKEGTQEEFFHTFNALYDNKRQIVMTSDRPPKEISDLEQRLVSRFEQGLQADLKQPNFETRAAILKKKAYIEKIDLDNRVIDFIAEYIHNNVRVLEGALTRIIAHASISGISTADINTADARDILAHLISDDVQEISMDLILEKICKSYGISATKLLDKTRKKNIAFPRQVGMYLSSILLPQLSLKEIANFFKRKDHTTVKYAKEKMETLYKTDRDFRMQVEEIITEIKGNI